MDKSNVTVNQTEPELLRIDNEIAYHEQCIRNLECQRRQFINTYDLNKPVDK